MSMSTVSVIVPVHNERATLREALERLLKAQLPVATEIIVVDDGSTDEGLATIADLRSARDEIRVFRHLRRMGKGAAIRTGLRHATGELTAILDADLEYDPADYAKLLDPLLQGEARVAYGTRIFGAHTAFSFWYVVGNKVINLLASAMFNAWLSDLSTCLKIAETDLWRSLDLRCVGFDFDAEATAKFLRKGERIYEVPISYRARDRVAGKKVRVQDGLRHLRALVLVRLGRL